MAKNDHVKAHGKKPTMHFAEGGIVARDLKGDKEVPKNQSRYGGADLPATRYGTNEANYWRDRGPLEDEQPDAQTSIRRKR